MECIESRVATLVNPKQVAFHSQRIDMSSTASEEIVAETLYSAISTGTEVAAWRGDPPLRPGGMYPRLVGYCNVAKVLQVGANVTTTRPGSIVFTHQSHRSHFRCNQDAVIAELPSDLALTSAVTLYFFHLAYSAVLAGRFIPGHQVGIIGLGVLGVAATMLLDSFGALTYAISDQDDGLAKIGALSTSCAVLKQAAKTEAPWCEVGDAEGLDLVVSSSNRWEDWHLALEIVRKGGVIATLGFPGRAQPPPFLNPLSTQYFYEKQLHLVACGKLPDSEVPPDIFRFTLKRNFAFLIAYMRSGRIIGDSLVSKIARASDLAAVYQQLDERKHFELATVLDWTCQQ